MLPPRKFSRYNVDGSKTYNHLKGMHRIIYRQRFDNIMDSPANNHSDIKCSQVAAKSSITAEIIEFPTSRMASHMEFNENASSSGMGKQKTLTLLHQKDVNGYDGVAVDPVDQNYTFDGTECLRKKQVRNKINQMKLVENSGPELSEEKELKDEAEQLINKVTDVIVGTKYSDERLLDVVPLYLHNIRKEIGQLEEILQEQREAQTKMDKAIEANRTRARLAETLVWKDIYVKNEEMKQLDTQAIRADKRTSTDISTIQDCNLEKQVSRVDTLETMEENKDNLTYFKYNLHDGYYSDIGALKESIINLKLEEKMLIEERNNIIKRRIAKDKVWKKSTEDELAVIKKEIVSPDPKERQRIDSVLSRTAEDIRLENVAKADKKKRTEMRKLLIERNSYKEMLRKTEQDFYTHMEIRRETAKPLQSGDRVSSYLERGVNEEPMSKSMANCIGKQNKKWKKLQKEYDKNTLYIEKKQKREAKWQSRILRLKLLASHCQANMKRCIPEIKHISFGRKFRVFAERHLMEMQLYWWVKLDWLKTSTACVKKRFRKSLAIAKERSLESTPVLALRKSSARVKDATSRVTKKIGIGISKLKTTKDYVMIRMQAANKTLRKHAKRAREGMARAGRKSSKYLNIAYRQLHIALHPEPFITKPSFQFSKTVLTTKVRGTNKAARFFNGLCIVIRFKNARMFNNDTVLKRLLNDSPDHFRKPLLVGFGRNRFYLERRKLLWKLRNQPTMYLTIQDMWPKESVSTTCRARVHRPDVFMPSMSENGQIQEKPSSQTVDQSENEKSLIQIVEEFIKDSDDTSRKKNETYLKRGTCFKLTCLGTSCVFKGCFVRRKRTNQDERKPKHYNKSKKKHQRKFRRVAVKQGIRTFSSSSSLYPRYTTKDRGRRKAYLSAARRKHYENRRRDRTRQRAGLKHESLRDIKRNSSFSSKMFSIPIKSISAGNLKEKRKGSSEEVQQVALIDERMQTAIHTDADSSESTQDLRNFYSRSKGTGTSSKVQFEDSSSRSFEDLKHSQKSRTSKNSISSSKSNIKKNEWLSLIDKLKRFQQEQNEKEVEEWVGKLKQHTESKRKSKQQSATIKTGKFAIANIFGLLKKKVSEKNAKDVTQEKAKIQRLTSSSDTVSKSSETDMLDTKTSKSGLQRLTGPTKSSSLSSSIQQKHETDVRKKKRRPLRYLIKKPWIISRKTSRHSMKESGGHSGKKTRFKSFFNNDRGRKERSQRSSLTDKPNRTLSEQRTSKLSTKVKQRQRKEKQKSGKTKDSDSTVSEQMEEQNKSEQRTTQLVPGEEGKNEHRKSNRKEAKLGKKNSHSFAETVFGLFRSRKSPIYGKRRQLISRSIRKFSNRRKRQDNDSSSDEKTVNPREKIKKDIKVSQKSLKSHDELFGLGKIKAVRLKKETDRKTMRNDKMKKVKDSKSRRETRSKKSSSTSNIEMEYDKSTYSHGTSESDPASEEEIADLPEKNQYRNRFLERLHFRRKKKRDVEGKHKRKTPIRKHFKTKHNNKNTPSSSKFTSQSTCDNKEGFTGNKGNIKDSNKNLSKRLERFMSRLGAGKQDRKKKEENKNKTNPEESDEDLSKRIKMLISQLDREKRSAKEGRAGRNVQRTKDDATDNDAALSTSSLTSKIYKAIKKGKTRRPNFTPERSGDDLTDDDLMRNKARKLDISTHQLGIKKKRSKEEKSVRKVKSKPFRFTSRSKSNDSTRGSSRLSPSFSGTSTFNDSRIGMQSGRHKVKTHDSDENAKKRLLEIFHFVRKQQNEKENKIKSNSKSKHSEIIQFRRRNRSKSKDGRFSSSTSSTSHTDGEGIERKSEQRIKHNKTRKSPAQRKTSRKKFLKLFRIYRKRKGTEEKNTKTKSKRMQFRRSNRRGSKDIRADDENLYSSSSMSRVTDKKKDGKTGRNLKFRKSGQQLSPSKTSVKRLLGIFPFGGKKRTSNEKMEHRKKSNKFKTIEFRRPIRRKSKDSKAGDSKEERRLSSSSTSRADKETTKGRIRSKLQIKRLFSSTRFSQQRRSQAKDDSRGDDKVSSSTSASQADGENNESPRPRKFKDVIKAFRFRRQTNAKLKPASDLPSSVGPYSVTLTKRRQALRETLRALFSKKPAPSSPKSPQSPHGSLDNLTETRDADSINQNIDTPEHNIDASSACSSWTSLEDYSSSQSEDSDKTKSLNEGQPRAKPKTLRGRAARFFRRFRKSSVPDNSETEGENTDKKSGKKSAKK